MKLVVQYVSSASVMVNETKVAGIGQGLCVLVGFARSDTPASTKTVCQRLVTLRIIPDDLGKLNHNLLQSRSSVLVIPNFTLLGSTDGALRPEFSNAAKANYANSLFDLFITQLNDALGTEKVASGIFASHMHLTLNLNGPVTYILEG